MEPTATDTRSSNAMAWLAAALLAVLPLAHTVALRHALTALALMFLIIRLRTVALPQRAINIPVAIWLVFTASSMMWSIDPWLSANAWLDEAFYGFVLFYLFYAVGACEPVRGRLTGATTVGIACLAVLSLFGYDAIAPDVIRTGLLYYYPGVGQASTFAVFALPVFVVVLFEKARRVHAVVGLVTCVIAGTVSFNRMFWPTAVLTLLCALGYRRLSSGRLYLVAALLALGGMVALGSVSLLRNDGGRIPQDPMAAVLGEIKVAFKDDPRPEIWRAFGTFVLERPWLGLGFGKPVIKDFSKAHESAHVPSPGKPFWEHSHNLLLNIVLQTGMLGLLLYLWLLGALARCFAKMRPVQPASAWAGLALIAALLLKNLTDDFMRDSIAMYFWGLVGWLLAAATQAPARGKTACSH